MPVSPSLVRKLNPNRFPGMSPKMGAILGCILGEEFTNPNIDELCVTSDGMLLGRLEGDCGMNEFLGSAADLRRNIKNLMDVAGLDESEADEFANLYYYHCHAPADYEPTLTFEVV